MDANQKISDAEPRLESLPLGKLMKTIIRKQLSPPQNFDPTTAKISRCKYAASYSWVDEEAPTILVSGQPATWTPPTGPQRLRPDRAEFYRDPNAARYPQYPIEPVVRSILSAQPELSTADISIVACISTLGSLLWLARGIESNFRFDVQVVGKIVFFSRKENSATELIPDMRGFGHSFQDAYTAGITMFKDP